MDISIRVERASLTAVRTPLLVVNLFEGVDEPSGATGAVNDALGGLIARLISDGEIKGNAWRDHDRSQPGRPLTPRSRPRRRGRAREARRPRPRSPARGLGDGGPQGSRSAPRPLCDYPPRRRRRRPRLRLAAKTVLEASLLSLYTYIHYKTPPETPRPTLDEIVVVERDDDRAEVIEAAAAEAALLVDAVNLARDLSQAPGNVMTPTVLADRAREMAEARGLAIQVWGKDELREQGMNAILAVNSGSAQEPALRDDEVRLRQRGREDAGRGRQGHHLRQRRHLDQARRPHGEHEARHVRRGRGDRLPARPRPT